MYFFAAAWEQKGSIFQILKHYIYKNGKEYL